MADEHTYFAKAQSIHDGSNFRRGPPTPQARKMGKIYEINSTPLPLIIQILQFLWISKDLWKFSEILRNFHENRFEKRRIIQFDKKDANFAKFTKKSRKIWRDFAKFPGFKAVQRNGNLVDLEKWWKMRLLSLSEASIQPRTSLPKFLWNRGSQTGVSPVMLAARFGIPPHVLDSWARDTL